MYVTDTHPLIWYLKEDYKKLSRVREKFDDAAIHERCVIFVPTVVVWEMSLLAKTGRLSFGRSFAELLETLFSVRTFIEEPVTSRIVSRSHDLNFHTDPFDTLIVATALEKELPLITNDGLIHDAKPCELFWD